MKIVGDENIPYLKACFGHVAEVTALNGRKITRSDVVDADALIVRSVTPVTRELLAGSSVRFVGSCTIGIDHVDTDFLDEKGIAFASAPGSNADSAAQYTLAAMLALEERHAGNLRQATVGIVGCGNVGSRVKALLDALGVRTLVNDPFLQDRGREGLVDLDTALQADIVTLHVPLTRGGKYPTYHLLNADKLNSMNPKAMLINCARGDVIDAAALQADISRNHRHVALDVWPNEPLIDEQLLSMVQIATPHIAGYSFDGKLRGTQMVYQAFCKALGITPQAFALDVDAPDAIVIPVDASVSQAVQQAVRQSYDILADDAALRDMLHEPREHQGAFFDRLRKNYPIRREFSVYPCCGGAPTVQAVLQQLGFSSS